MTPSQKSITGFTFFSVPLIATKENFQLNTNAIQVNKF